MASARAGLDGDRWKLYEILGKTLISKMEFGYGFMVFLGFISRRLARAKIPWLRGAISSRAKLGKGMVQIGDATL